MELFEEVDYLKSKYDDIQLTKKELILIIESIRKVENCNLLIFGLGNDTGLWIEANKNKRTAFIENNAE